MARTYRSAMPQPESESDAWDALGLSAALDECIDGAATCNEWPYEHGDSSRELYSELRGYSAPDGNRYHILFASDWSACHAPWTDTYATLYRTDDPADMAEFAHDIAEWESKPDTDPEYEDHPGDLQRTSVR